MRRTLLSSFLFLLLVLLCSTVASAANGCASSLMAEEDGLSADVMCSLDRGVLASETEGVEAEEAEADEIEADEVSDGPSPEEGRNRPRELL